MQPNLIARQLDPETRKFYEHTLNILRDSQIPFIVGGAYAFERYTGIARHTKDLDLFVREQDCEQVLAVLAAAGYQTELTFPHWLAKAYCGDDFVDVIFSSGNSLSVVDDTWFEHAADDEVLGIPIKLCPPEEMLWSKMFIMERERYDGADVAHLLRAVGERLDWERLMRNVGDHWRVLLSHLILFGFIYPSHRAIIPNDVLHTLLRRLEAEMQSTPPQEKLCQGTLISRAQYLPDIEEWGYRDARLVPRGNMTPKEAEQWTAAIDAEE
ncbi:MAG TPA: nucleotidyltransferase [Herpetosiphonaceae bacterium]